MILTDAKPYAKAIFDLALEENQLTMWLRLLNNLALAFNAAEKIYISKNPNISLERKLALFSDITKENNTLINLVKLLIKRKKLRLLPSIAKSYRKMFFFYKKIIKVKMISAKKLSASNKIKLINKLKEKYQTKILISFHTDETLIGGAKIYIENKIIDSSIKGRILRLKKELLLPNFE